MSRVPMIYANRKRMYTGDSIYLNAIPSADYRWTFTVPPISADFTNDTMMVQFPSGSDGSIFASWSNGTTESNYDEFEILFDESDSLSIDENPQTIYENLDFYPITKDKVYVGINDFGTNNVINSSIEKLYTCFNYIIDKLKYVEVETLEASHRYGRSYSPLSASVNEWQQVSIDYPSGGGGYYMSFVTNPLSATEIASNTSTTIFVSADTLCAMSNSTGRTPTVYERGYPVFSVDPFVNIKDIHLTEDGIIWIIENSGRLSKLEYTTGSWKFLGSWTDKVYSPKKMAVVNDKVYIISSVSNSITANALHIFDKNLTRLGTIYNSNCPVINGVAICRDYIILLGASNEIYKYDINNTYNANTDQGLVGTPLGVVYAFSLGSNSFGNGDMLRISTSNDPYFFYGASKNVLFKYTQNGALVGVFGLQMPISCEFYARESYDITGISIDANSNLYVSSNRDIVRYVDYSNYEKLVSYDIYDDLWSLDDLKIKANENCSYWVYNRMFNRFYDNILLLYNSISGKIKGDINGLYTSSLKLSEYKPLPYTKGDIYIGVNELHSEAAINRNLSKLYDCLSVLLDLLKLKSISIPELEEFRGSFDILWNGIFSFDGTVIFNGTYAK